MIIDSRNKGRMRRHILYVCLSVFRYLAITISTYRCAPFSHASSLFMMLFFVDFSLVFFSSFSPHLIHPISCAIVENIAMLIKNEGESWLYLVRSCGDPDRASFSAIVDMFLGRTQGDMEGLCTIRRVYSFTQPKHDVAIVPRNGLVGRAAASRSFFFRSLPLGRVSGSEGSPG